MWKPLRLSHLIWGVLTIVIAGMMLDEKVLKGERACHTLRF